MRKLMAMIATLAVAAAVVASPAFATTAAPAKMKTHDVAGEIVSIDAKAHSITFKDDKGESHTAPVLGKAIAELKNHKAGDKVTVTCRDDEKGDHKGITAIK